MPVEAESSFESVVVIQNEYVEAPGNEDLKHNISNFTVTVGGNAVSANFLDVTTPLVAWSAGDTRPLKSLKSPESD